MGIIVEEHCIPSCGTCIHRQAGIPSDIPAELHLPGRVVVIRSTWTCPTINLMTTDEAPACTEYRFDAETGGGNGEKA